MASGNAGARWPGRVVSLVLACAVVAAAVVVSGMAAEAAPVPGRRPVHAAQATPERAAAGDQSVTLTLTKARRVTFPQDVRDVIVADPAVADVVIKTPRLVYMIGNKSGDTNAIFLDSSGHQVAKVEIHVEHDLAALHAAITELLPGADVKLASLKDDIVISGTVSSPSVADSVRQLARRFVAADTNIVNMTKVTGAQQVLIRVKVAEMRRSVTKRLGTRFFLQNGDISTGWGGGVQEPFGFLIGQGANALQNGFATGLTGTAAITAVRGSSQHLMSFEGLERDGLVKVLAEPNLTAVSGEPASFLAGGEFPIPVGQANNVITLEYRQFGIALNFTPVVLDRNRISLRISTEFSEIDPDLQFAFNNVIVQGLSVRRANTTVEMASGSSLVLAGLLRNEITNRLNGLPGLKDIPILGSLFRSTDFQRNETELMVIATPIIVRPTTPGEVTLPTDGFGMAGDVDLYLLNGLYSRYGKPAASAGETAPDHPGGYLLR